MEVNGQKGGFSEDAPKPTCDSFIDNYQKLVAEQEALTEVQSLIVRSAKGADVTSLQARKTTHSKQIVHYKSMLARQITTNIWHEPRQSYLDKLRERETIARELNKLTGEEIPAYDTDVIPITFAMICKDLKQSN